MVKGHERKSYQPSSSSKAAQLLASSAPKAGGFGFGGFSGATPVAGTSTAADAAATDIDSSGTSAVNPALTGELDGEITQLLRSLSKRDATTKSKALQRLKAVIASKDAATVAACLPAWAYVYNKLVMDNNRTVRSEASGVQGAVAKVVGKGLAPYLKALAGSWWLAQFDLHSEAAAAAWDAFQAAFAGPKQKEALLFTRTEVLLFLQDTLKATPESLGDARKETAEELAERHERVVAASLLALSSLLDLLVSKKQRDSPIERDAQSEVVVQLESLLSTQGFLKRVLASKSPHVRNAAYTLIAHLCYRAPQLLEKHMQAAAPLVLGVFHEQHAGAHPSMWDMVLAFGRAYPSAWHMVDMRKAVLPRLLAFLRSGCHGSARTSYPAVLPFLHLLPQGLLGPDPKAANDIVEALWIGRAKGKDREAADSAFTECLCWLLTQADALTGAGQGAAEGYATAVLQGSMCSQVVPAVFQGNCVSHDSQAAQSTIVEVFRQTMPLKGNMLWLPSVIANQLGRAVAEVLNSLLSSPSSEPASASTPVTKFSRAGDLLDALRLHTAADQQLLATAVAGPIAGALVGSVQQGNALPEAASLLATLVKQFGAAVMRAAPTVAVPGSGRTTGEQDAQSLSIQTIISSALAGPQQGPGAQASADLLLSCLHGKPSPAQELADTLHTLLGPPSPDAPHSQAPISSIAAKGAALGVLLVQRLLQTVVQHPSQVLEWRSHDLDKLADQLVTAADSVAASDSAAAADNLQAGSQAEPGRLEVDKAAASDTTSLAASVAAAPLDASEKTAAAQETPVSDISNGLAHLGLKQAAGDVQEIGSCAQLLGLLIGGKGHMSLLTEQAVQDVLWRLKASLESVGDHSGPRCLFALHALDLCLYSEALAATTTMHEFRNQLTALVFRLSWDVQRPIQLAKDYTRHVQDPCGEGSSQTSSDDDVPAAEPAVAEAESAAANGDAAVKQSLSQQVAQAGTKVWAQGLRAQALLATAPLEDWSSLESELHAALVPHLNKVCSHEPQEVDWQLQLTSLIKEAVDAVTPDPSINSPSSILSSVLEPLSSCPEQQATRTLLAAGLCQVMGFQAVLLRDTPSGLGMRWTAMDRVSSLLLRHCRTQINTALQETAQHLLCFLMTYPMPEPLYEEGQSTLLSDTLAALSSAARSSTTFPDTTDGDIFQTSQVAACLPALVQLLENLSTTARENRTYSAVLSPWFRGTVLSQWLRSTVVDASDAYPSSVLLELLPIVVPFLRSHKAAFANSGIYELTQQLLSRSARLPPAAAVMSQLPNSDKLTDILQTLNIICACFPCPSRPLATPSGGQPTTAVGQGSAPAEAPATTAERQALLAATLRQMQGERSVALAVAAARRVTEGQEDDSSAAAAASTSGGVTGNVEAADASVARLILCTVNYCWKDISAHDWSAMLKRVSTSASQAAVLVEELTEDVAAAATEGASMVSRGRQGGNVQPQVAVELLWRLHHTGLSHKAEGAQVAQQKMSQLLTSQESLGRLGGAPQASLQTLAAILTLNAGQQPAALQEPAPQDPRLAEYQQSGAQDALRMLLACGAIEAITWATGESAAASCAMWQASSQAMWEAVAAIALSASSEASFEAVTASVQEADTWAPDIGVDATGSLMTLLLSPNAQPGLQQAALALLLTKPLLPSVTAASTRADEESPEMPPAKSDAVTALMRAGIRPQLAAAICDPPADPILDPSDHEEVQSLQPFLLAWAVLLAHILEMPAGDSGKAFLAQALRDEYEVVPDLLRAILPLLPLEKASASKKDKATSSSSGKQATPKQWDIVIALQKLGVADDTASICKLAEAVYRGVLHALPASARAWFGDLRDRGLSAAVEAFTAEQESPLLLQHEFQLVQTAPALPDMHNFSLKANSITREVVAVMEIEDGAVLEMVIKLPTSSPLRRAEVACRRRVGVTEGKLRKWLLSVTAFLANQNGSVAEAIALWQRNVQKEFEGVEECLICYSIVSASDGKLPRMHCKTCSKRFHGTCLYKWFQSSGKSNCPHCQSPW